MPGGDRTGPMGQGPRTGRASGFCAGYDTPGYVKGSVGGWGAGYGRGMGRGYGRGQGFGRGMGYGWSPHRGWQSAGWLPERPWMPVIGKEDEKKLLKSQVESLKRYQKEIEKKLGELEKEGD